MAARPKSPATPPPPTVTPPAPAVVTPAAAASPPTPPAPTHVDPWSRWTALGTIGLVVVTIALVGVGWWQGWTAVNTLNGDTKRRADEDAAKKIYDWQKFMVYRILSDGSQKVKEPLDFDYIRAEYLKAAEQQIQNNTDDSVGPRLKGKDISDDTLRKILMDLHTGRVVEVAYPGQKYMIEESAFKDLEDAKVYDWQRLMVYRIVVEGSAKQKEPLDFDYIKGEYLKAAQQQLQNAGADDSAVVRLKGKDISDEKLKKILMELHVDRVIYVMYPGPKYMIEEATFNPEGPRLLNMLAAERYAHDLLVTEPDRYTIDQLTIKIAEQNHMEQAECRYALDQLLHTCFIKAGDGGKLSLNLTPMGK